MNRYFISATKWFFLSLSLILTGCSSTLHKPVVTPQRLNQIHAHYANIDYGRIEYYRYGSGKPIVLITGYVTDVSSWNRAFLNALAQHNQLIIFNNRNVGGSTVTSKSYNSKDLANDTYQLIQQLHLKKPAVLGISMGGMIAQQLAVTHPNAVGRLILINTAIAGKQAVHPTPAVEEKLYNLPENKLNRYMIAVELFFPSSDRMQMSYDLATDRFIPSDYQEINVHAVQAQQRELVKDWLKDNVAAKKLQHLKIPVLILNGGADEVIPPVNSEILKHNIPQTKLIRWQNGGHAMIYQYPQALADVISDFVRS